MRFSSVTRRALIALMCAFASATVLAAEARLLRQPDICRDKIVFCYGGDLYIASAKGQHVRQLTSLPGEVSFPKFSPDGEQIAFTADAEGSKDVYVISSLGGKPTRLTFHPADEVVVDWRPDGKSILFRSNGSSFSYRFSRLHEVPAGGGLPTVLELPEAESASLNDAGSLVAFCRTGVAGVSFKRYRGGMAPQVWIYDFATRRAERAVSGEAGNDDPVWMGDSIYFVSDRGDGTIQNLWAYDTKRKALRQITTNKEWGVEWPSKGDGAIIYASGGRLFTYDPKAQRVSAVHIEVPQRESTPAAQVKNVKGLISGAPSLSADGRRVLVSARGDLFLLDPERKLTRNVTQTPGANERSPAWNPVEPCFAYVSDRSGEDQIYLQKDDGSLSALQISQTEPSRLSMLNWSPDGKKLGYSDHRACYYILDPATKASKKIFFNAYLGSDKFVSASWSPDSRWLVYACGNPNWFSSIYLYSLEEEKTYRVTDERIHAYSPQFDPDGKYLYWIADCQVNVEDSYWDGGHHMINPSRILVATLRSDALSPLSEEPLQGAIESGEKLSRLRIDVEGLGQRIVPLPIEDSSYSDLTVSHGRVVYESSPAKGEPALKMFDMAARKESVLVKEAWSYSPAANAERIAYRTAEGIGVLSIGPEERAGDSPLDLSGLTMTIDRRSEWRQIFYEAWRIQRDFFFDEKLHGVDWEAMKRKYEVLLPQVASRGDLNHLIEDLFSELGQSHVEISGGDLPQRRQANAGLLGIDLLVDKGTRSYQIAKIYRGQPWDADRSSPLMQPGMNIRAGDYLLAIDGTPLHEGVNPDELLENKAGSTVVLTLNGRPSLEGSRSVKVRPAAFSEQYGDLLRYNDWVMANMEKVSQATGGRVGYIHFPDTYIPGIESFFRHYHAQLDKQALVLDIRFNSGGYLPHWMIERLNRKALLYSCLPHGKAPLKEPDPVLGGPLVCIANEWTESGGEMFAALFRQLRCGAILGQRTSGNLASTGGFRLMDGGVVVYPALGKVDARGQGIIENVGVSPDVEAVNRPDDVIRGLDPQLSLSVEEIMRKLAVQDKRD